MFPLRTHTRQSCKPPTQPRKISRLAVAVSPGLAVAALAAGACGAGPASAAAQPASVSRQAQPTAVSASVTARGADSAGTLDGFARPVSASLRDAAAAAASAAARRHHRKRPYRYHTPREIGRAMLRVFHWRKGQFKYLNWLWDRESGWNKYATNPYSGAYGIPQALPAWKMASAGPDYQTNARTQIRWGMRYIRARYGSPERAWDHEISVGWYVAR